MMAVDRKKCTPGAIRVLCVNLESAVGGAEQSLLLLARFVPKGVQVSVACPAGLLTDRLRELNIETYKIHSAPRKFNHTLIWLFYFSVVNLQLIPIVIRTRPRIIHANSLKTVLAVVLAKAVTGRKLIWHMRDLKCSGLLGKLCGCLSSKVIAISQAVKNKLISRGVKPELVRVIYNGVVVSDPIPETEEQREQCDVITFANIGQFVPWKKQPLFIEAAERFLREGQKARFILIGDDIFKRDGEYKKELFDRVRASRFSSNITIIGWQDVLDSYWSKIDCLVHTAEAEPFGRVVIEAMAQGVPVIAAAGGGPSEIITDGKTGLLFCPDDVEELLKRMGTISSDSKLSQNLARNARQCVISNFQAKQTAEKITKVYEELTTA